MARSSDRATTWGGRLGAWFTAAVTGLIAVATLVVAVTEAEGRTTNLTVAAMTGSVALLMAAAGSARVPGWQPTEDGAGWVLPLTGGRVSLLPVSLVCLVFGGALVVGATGVGSAAVAVLLLLLAALMLLLGAELLRAWLRRPRLTLTADRIELRGTGVDAELAWDDVGTVDYVGLGTRWAAVGVRAVRDAPSYRSRASRLLLPMDREPESPGLEVRAGVVPDAPALLELLRAMHVVDRSGRQALLARGPGAGAAAGLSDGSPPSRP